MLGSGVCQLTAQDPPTSSDELRITVYDEADLPNEIVLDAFNQLRVIFHQAGIAVNIAVGDPDDEEGSLFTYIAVPPNGRERQAACEARRNIRMKIIGASPASLPKMVLGMSSPFARTGLNVRLFSDHVREAADRHSKPYAITLSYAMAHEIGHVLLRSGSHGSWGIMSSVWTAHEYACMTRAGLLFFTDDETKTMLANLGGIGCPNSAKR